MSALADAVGLELSVPLQPKQCDRYDAIDQALRYGEREQRDEAIELLSRARVAAAYNRTRGEERARLLQEQRDALDAAQRVLERIRGFEQYIQLQTDGTYNVNWMMIHDILGDAGRVLEKL